MRPTLVLLVLAACGTPKPATYRASLAATAGIGAGVVRVTPRATPAGTFAARITVEVTGAASSTSFLVQRAPELGRANGADGTCQRALGLPPWSPADPPAPAFVTFLMPPNNAAATLTTSPDGTGALTLDTDIPTVRAGTTFDVMFRLVDDEAHPRIELRSECFTVTAR